MHPIISKLAEVLSQHQGVEKIVLFGSRARGDHNPRSDIDLAIYGPNISPQTWTALLEDIEQADTLLTIDCVHYDKANVSLKAAVDHEGVILYELKS